MDNWLERTEMLLSEKAMLQLKEAHAAIFGIGGVGGYVAEALARGGIARFTLIDNDIVSVSNINRQIVATTLTIGQFKTDVMRDRIYAINPEAVVNVHHCFFLPGDKEAFLPLRQYSYVVDAIDTVTAKLELAFMAEKEGVPIISSMGTGNKLNPLAFEVADIYKTSVCPLAKVMRRELKAKGVKSLKVVYSKEEPIRPEKIMIQENGRMVPGSVSFVPSAVGLIIAGEVIKDIINI